tara:strand:+ start:904 stop:2235 length:1332 start_codon:yes stop_codon:yes gene_type:complete
MNKVNIFDRCLGLILTSKDQSLLLAEMNPDWFSTKKTKAIFDALKHIVSTGELADILNIVQWLRKHERLNDCSAYDITKLTSDIPMTDYMNPSGVLNECHYTYSVRECHLVVQNCNKELTSINPSSQNVLNFFQKGIDILSDVNKPLNATNEDSINKVLDQHNNAKNGISIGLDLGWKTLQRYVVLEDDDVMVVGGRPAMGKTAWAISLIRNLVFDQKKNVIFFSLEMSKERIIRRLISLILNIDSNKIKFGECNDLELSHIETLKSHSLWNNLSLFDGSHKVSDIQSEVMRLSATKKIDVMIIDYLQKIIPEKSDSRYHEVTRISNDVKRLVMASRIPCIALAQLNRDVGRSGKRPSLPDLKESGEIEQDASIVSFLHRPEYYGDETDDNGNSMINIGEFITAKNRDGEIGITEMKVNLATSSWADYNREIPQYSSDHDNNF